MRKFLFVLLGGVLILALLAVGAIVAVTWAITRQIAYGIRKLRAHR